MLFPACFWQKAFGWLFLWNFKKAPTIACGGAKRKAPYSVEQGAQQIRARQGYFARQAPCLLQ